jgi:hypothetical protein
MRISHPLPVGTITAGGRFAVVPADVLLLVLVLGDTLDVVRNFLQAGPALWMLPRGLRVFDAIILKMTINRLNYRLTSGAELIYGSARRFLWCSPIFCRLLFDFQFLTMADHRPTQKSSLVSLFFHVGCALAGQRH